MRAATLTAQGVALKHAEAVLLIDYGEAEVVEVCALLDQGVGADHEVEHPRGHLLVNLSLAGGAHTSG